MTNKSEKGQNLDLGLSALLQEVSSASASSPETEANPNQKNSVDDDLKLEVKKNKYEELADSQNWLELMNVCESELRDNPKNVTEVRLWWVVAQLKGQRMPATLLTAPLETATEELKTHGDQPALLNLTARTLAELGQALLAAGDGAAAVSFLKRAADLAPQYLETLLHAARHEIHRLDSLRDLSTRQLAERDQQLDVLRAFVPDANKVSATIKTPEQRILEDLKRSAIEREVRKEQRLQGKIRAKATALLSVLGASPIMRVITVAIIAVAGGVMLSPHILKWFQSSPGMMAFGVGLTTQPPTLKLPELDKIDSVSAFDGLYYDLKNDRPASAADGSLRSRVVSPATKGTSTISGSKEVLSMSGPVEPQEMQQALSQPPQAPSDKSSEILFGGGGAGGGSSGGSASFPSNSGSVTGQNSSNSKVYRIIAHTRIIASPSYKTEVLGTLQSGDRVSAEGRVDSWIQIRSASGKIGFILAQDAVPES